MVITWYFLKEQKFFLVYMASLSKDKSPVMHNEVCCLSIFTWKLLTLLFRQCKSEVTTSYFSTEYFCSCVLDLHLFIALLSPATIFGYETSYLKSDYRKLFYLLSAKAHQYIFYIENDRHAWYRLQCTNLHDAQN